MENTRPAIPHRGVDSRPVRECHKCPRNGKGDDYCWRHCKGAADDSRKGRSLVNLGGMEAEGEYLREKMLADRAADRDERDTAFAFFDECRMPDRPSASAQTVTATLSAETERSMVVVISELFALPDIQLCILKHLLFGEDYGTIGRTLPKPMSKEAVQKNLVAMKGRCGFVANIMRGMQIRGEGGAKRKAAYNLELDL